MDAPKIIEGGGGSDPRSASGASLGAGPNGIFGDADDARGSQGVVRCDSAGAPKPDPVYALNVQVTPRKAPSALDAGFFSQLFWDGRATGQFRDPLTNNIVLNNGVENAEKTSEMPASRSHSR